MGIVRNTKEFSISYLIIVVAFIAVSVEKGLSFTVLFLVVVVVVLFFFVGFVHGTEHVEIINIGHSFGLNIGKRVGGGIVACSEFGVIGIIARISGRGGLLSSSFWLLFWLSLSLELLECCCWRCC